MFHTRRGRHIEIPFRLTAYPASSIYIIREYMYIYAAWITTPESRDLCKILPKNFGLNFESECIHFSAHIPTAAVHGTLGLSSSMVKHIQSLGAQNARRNPIRPASRRICKRARAHAVWKTWRIARVSACLVCVFLHACGKSLNAAYLGLRRQRSRLAAEWCGLQKCVHRRTLI